MKQFAIWCAIFLSSSAFAQPEKIDILGLVPGESTLEEVKAASSSTFEDRLFFLEIGGHKVACMPEFIASKLSSLFCPTGDKLVTNASNFEIHSDLVKGFTKKFGPTTSAIENKVRTTTGVEYKGEELWWTDKIGNSLILYSLQGRVDRGLLRLLSAEGVKKLREDSQKKESQRRF